MSDLEQLRAEHAAMKKALEACAAWHWYEAEGYKISGNHNCSMELCRYSEHLTLVALRLVNADEPYSGVPHMVVWPHVEIQRADEDEAQHLVNQVIEMWRQRASDGLCAVNVGISTGERNAPEMLP